MEELLKQAAEVLVGYEQWEADMILSNEAWSGGMAELPTLTWDLWDKLTELQRRRNEVVRMLRELNVVPAASQTPEARS